MNPYRVFLGVHKFAAESREVFPVGVSKHSGYSHGRFLFRGGFEGEYGFLDSGSERGGYLDPVESFYRLIESFDGYFHGLFSD